MKKYILLAFMFVFGLVFSANLVLAQSVTSPLVSSSVAGDVDPETTSNCINLSNNLRYRDRDVNKNGEVSTLQDFLQTKGYLNSEPTGYFGLLTQKAVKAFQSANGISPTGYVGPLTRAKINALSCGGDSTPSITVLSPNGGENIQVGSQYNIVWESKNLNNSANVSFVLKDDSVYCAPNITGCQSSFYINSSVNTGNYLWDTNSKMSGGSTGPNSIKVSPGSKYKIGVCYGEVCDYSNNYFTITPVASNTCTNGATNYPTCTVSTKVLPQITNTNLSSPLVKGTNVIYKFKISASTPIAWKRILFSLGGTLGNSTELKSSSLWDADTNTKIDGYSIHDNSVINFFATNEQKVTTVKNYELRNTFTNSPTIDETLTVKVNQVSSSSVANTFAQISVTPASFIWSDLSATNHSANTLDWYNDYGVISTATQSFKGGATSTITPGVSVLPRIMYWSGKVNQHINLTTGAWETDPDGVSGANLNVVYYCQKWYPKTNSVIPYKEETISTWKLAGNIGNYTATKMSYECSEKPISN